MSWECGYCNRSDDRDEVVDAVCHHCGILVCREHQYSLFDDAFRGPSRLTGRWAIHCAECRRAHHPRSLSIVRVLRP